MTTRPQAEVSREPGLIIALTHEFYPERGGIATYVQEVASAVIRDSRRIEVWAPSRPHVDRSRFPFVVKDLPVSGSQSWPCRIRLAVHLLKQRPALRDAVYFLPEPGPIVTWMYLQLLQGLPAGGLVITLHGTEINRFTAPVHRRILFRRLLRKARRIGVVSNYVKHLLVDRFPELAPKVVLAPGAPRTDLDPLPSRRKAHSSSKPTVLLTVARIHPRKGQLAVLEALSRMPADLRDRLEYRIAGPVARPSYLRRLEKFAGQHGLAMRHLGSLDEKALSEAYEDADIFVMTSVAYHRSVEGLGLGYLEASASGLPIVAHRIGGAAEAVRQDETGLLVDPEDRDGLARAISDLVNSPERRHTLGTAGRHWARRFSWDTTARALFGDID